MADRRPTNATMLVDHAQEEVAELFHTRKGEPFVALENGGHLETYPIHGSGFRGWLRRLYYRATAAAVAPADVQTAVDNLAAIASFDGIERDVHVRYAKSPEGLVVIDRGDSNWSAIEVSPQGWRVVDRSPVYFRRPAGMLELPTPESGGQIAELGPFINVKPGDDFHLMVGWLLGALSSGPYPVLSIQGEQGTAKSTAARMLRELIDPVVGGLRSAPRDVRDLMVSANNAHVCAFDNLSHVPEWLSDALCRLSTGGGFSTRQLYSDDAEVLFDCMRPVLMTGVGELAARGDLLDRSIVITLAAIDDRDRRQESELWSWFRAVQPRLIGALLDGVAASLRAAESPTDIQFPRMADFTHWTAKAEVAFTWLPGTIAGAYARNRQGAVENLLDGDPVAEAIQRLVERGTWTGVASTLLQELRMLSPDFQQRPPAWPTTAKGLAEKLRRLSPAFRRVGVEIVTNQRSGKDRRRLISIVRC